MAAGTRAKTKISQVSPQSTSKHEANRKKVKGAPCPTPPQTTEQNTTLGNPLTICRGLWGPPGPKPRKSLKRVSRGLRPREPPRVWKKSGKSLLGPRRDFSRLSRLFETFSRLSGGPGAGGQETFFRLFREFGPGGPERPLQMVNGFPTPPHKELKMMFLFFRQFLLEGLLVVVLCRVREPLVNEPDSPY